MRDQANVVEESLPVPPQPYDELALGVECAWPGSIPQLEALSEAAISIKFQL